MTIKSVIDIDINDERFQRFKKLYDQYDAAVKKTPKAWRDVMSSVDGVRDALAEASGEIDKAAAKRKAMVEADKASAKAVSDQARAWGEVVRLSRAASVTIKDMTFSLMKWGGIIGAVTGILGAAGGLFGVTRMVQGVSADRRTSMGTGASIGARKAFNLNFGRIVDADQVFGGVNAALTDVSQRHHLYNAGLREDQLGGSTDQVAANLLGTLKKLADSTDDRLLGTVHGARGLSNIGLSVEDFQRLKKMSPSEFAALQKTYGTDRSKLDYNDPTARAWQDLMTQMGRAGNEIETVFIKGLVPLAKPIENLSVEVTKLVSAFFGDGKHLSELMGDVAKGIESLAKWVGTEEFKKGMETFGRGIVKIASGIAKFVGWFGGGDDNTSMVKSFAGTGSSTGSKGFGSFGSLIPGGNNVQVAGGINAKSDAGKFSPEMAWVARNIQQNVAGFGAVTAADDDYHKGRKSKHNEGLALDFRANDPSKSEETVASLRAYLTKLGIKNFTILDEYKNPSKGATGGHIHVGFADRQSLQVVIQNQTGGSATVQTNAAGVTQ